MKQTEVLNKMGRGNIKKFTNYKDYGYKYKVVRIPALQDEIKTKKVRGERASCVNEMSRLMDCWKRTDFNQSACAQETATFYQCVAEAKEKARLEKESQEKGEARSGSRFRPAKLVNEMLAKYPQPPTSIK